MNRDEKIDLLNRVPFWFHSIDCGEGVITNGRKDLALLQNELRQMSLPDLREKSVLDIGAWDGFFSFAAEELGAARVLALDHYVWSMNLVKQQKYWSECNLKNISPKPYHLIPGHWSPGTLPGKSGFDTAHQIKNSMVEQVVGDFMTIDPLEIGMFDIVFFLGVLYHLEEPLRGLKRLSMFTRELAVIETAAVYVSGYEDNSLLEFYEADELGGDVGNWFAPNLTGLKKLCGAAGFKRVEIVSAYPPDKHENLNRNEILRYRLTVHAYK